MNSIDIFEKAWLDLVFEGKNKAYGAYRLRRENSRTTLFALFTGMLLLTSIMGIPVLVNTLSGNATAPIIPEVPIVVHLSNFKPNLPKPQKQILPAFKKPVSDVERKEQLINPTVVEAQHANQNIASNTENQSTPENTNSNATGTTSTVVVNTGGTEIPTKPETTGTGIERTTSLDKLPEFPGGILKFYNYVGTNFGKTDIGEEKTIRIFVSFVIEKDGSMTDIKVPRDPGFGLGDEAVRVLRSLKTKWQPGMIAGKPVRTAYSLPIAVKTE